MLTNNTSKLIFRTIHLERWAFDVEMFMIANHLKSPVAEVPVNWMEIDGKTNNSIIFIITTHQEKLIYIYRYIIYNYEMYNIVNYL